MLLLFPNLRVILTHQQTTVHSLWWFWCPTAQSLKGQHRRTLHEENHKCFFEYSLLWESPTAMFGRLHYLESLTSDWVDFFLPKLCFAQKVSYRQKLFLFICKFAPLRNLCQYPAPFILPNPGVRQRHVIKKIVRCCKVYLFIMDAVNRRHFLSQTSLFKR